MHDAFAFIKALTIVLGVAAVVTIACQRLRQPVVLGYIIAGLIIGPHVPLPLVADQQIVQTLSELGVILLMFALGLEFSVGKLLKVGFTAGITAVVETSLMMWLGFMVGQALGWTLLERLFTGAIIAISSTTIISKVFSEQRIRGALRQFVVGVLIVEDLIAVVLMASLTAIASGKGLSAAALFNTTGRLAAFLVGLAVVGMLVVPRLVRAVVQLNRPETTLITAVGVCFGVAWLAHAAGYSVALGAFVAGSLIAESGEERRVERLVWPVRDLFAAIFFVSVGMMIDPALIARSWPAVALMSAVVIAGKIGGVTLGAFLTGQGMRTAVQGGMSLAQIGEFSFIIAGLGRSLGATGEFLYPVAVCVSAVTTLLTPALIARSGAAANFVDRQLPRSLQTFSALYGAWIERLRTAPPQRTRGALVRQLVGWLLVDAGVVAALAIGIAIGFDDVVAWVAVHAALTAAPARWLVVLAAAGATLPFIAGMARVGNRLAVVLATAALPAVAPDRVDLAGAPRRALVLAVQLTIVVLLGVPLVTITQPFLPGAQVAVGLAVVLLALVLGFWRSARHLQGHVRAGAQVITAALKAQSRAPQEPLALPHGLAELGELLPGLGAPVAVAVPGASLAVGKTLAELNLRGQTGATVLAIHRGQADVLLPQSGEQLRADDVLVLAGAEEAIGLARQVLQG